MTIVEVAIVLLRINSYLRRTIGSAGIAAAPEAVVSRPSDSILLQISTNEHFGSSN